VRDGNMSHHRKTVGDDQSRTTHALYGSIH
jgi:hypothetical protein